MDYLQYLLIRLQQTSLYIINVLNLVINGLPSIPEGSSLGMVKAIMKSFKPCYKWITFNT